MYQDEPIPEKNTLGRRLFGGRLNVRSYVVGNLLFFSCFVGVLLLIVNFGPENRGPVRSNLEVFLFLVIVAVWLVNVFFSFSFGIRRLHDHGKSGNWVLLYFVPIASLILVIYLFLPGERGENYYGPATHGRLSIRDLLGIG